MKYNDSNAPLTCMMTHSTWFNGAVEDSVPIGILWHDTASGNANIKRYVQPSEEDPNYQYLITTIGKNISKNDWNHKARDAGVNAFVGLCANI